MFNEDDTEAVLMIDASNAFNTTIRKAFLHNTKVLCPCLSLVYQQLLFKTIYAFRNYTTVSMVKQFVERKNRQVEKFSLIRKEELSVVTYGIRCKMSYALLRSSFIVHTREPVRCTVNTFN